MPNSPGWRIWMLILLLAAQVVTLVFFLHRYWDPPTQAQKASTGTEEPVSAKEGSEKPVGPAGEAKPKAAVATADGVKISGDADKKVDGAVVQTSVGKDKVGAPRPDEKAILLIVLLSGALGGALHALSSVISYVGNKTFDAAWVPWYFCRAPIGAGLGMAVYFALRAGLMTSAVSNEGLNIFGFAAISLLTGLFNRNAMAKLVKVSEAIFTAAPSESDPLQPTIVIVKLVPASVTLPVANPKPIKVTGSGFSNDVAVLVDGKPLPAAEVAVESDTRLTIEPTTILAAKGKKKIQVVRAGDKAAVSNIVEFEVS